MDTIKDLAVQLESTLYFQAYVDYALSQSVRMMGLMRTINYSSSNLESLLILYLTLVRTKLEYDSTVCNYRTSAEAKKLIAYSRIS